MWLLWEQIYDEDKSKAASRRKTFRSGKVLLWEVRQRILLERIVQLPQEEVCSAAVVGSGRSWSLGLVCGDVMIPSDDVTSHLSSWSEMMYIHVRACLGCWTSIIYSDRYRLLFCCCSNMDFMLPIFCQRVDAMFKSGPCISVSFVIYFEDGVEMVWLLICRGVVPCVIYGVLGGGVRITRPRSGPLASGTVKRRTGIRFFLVLSRPWHGCPDSGMMEAP